MIIETLFFIGLFAIGLPITISVDNLILNFVPDPIISFLILTSIIIPFCKTRNDWIFLILTYLHGLAHLVHPAFYGTVINVNYTPLYDFIVHGIQCICMYFYSKDLLPFGLILYTLCIVNGIIGHLDPTFMAQKIWLYFSVGGVIGTHYNTMLVNSRKDGAVFLGGAIIWGAAYSGYLDFKYLAEWDAFLNYLELYRLWYINFFFVIMAYFYLTDKFRIFNTKKVTESTNKNVNELTKTD